MSTDASGAGKWSTLKCSLFDAEKCSKLIPVASGKSGANIGRIKEETLVDIKIPQENSSDSTKIRIEGPKEGVLKAQEMLQVGGSA